MTEKVEWDLFLDGEYSHSVWLAPDEVEGFSNDIAPDRLVEIQRRQ